MMIHIGLMLSRPMTVSGSGSGDPFSPADIFTGLYDVSSTTLQTCLSPTVEQV